MCLGGRTGKGSRTLEGFRGRLVVVKGPLVGLYRGWQAELGVSETSGGRPRASEGQAALFGLHSRRPAKGRVGNVVVIVEEGVQSLWRRRGRRIAGVCGLVLLSGRWVGLGDQANEVVAHRSQR